MGLIIIRSPYWKNITTTPKTKCLIIVCTMNTKALFHATPMVLGFRRVSSSQTQEWTRLLVIHVIQIVHWGLSCLSFRKFLRAITLNIYRGNYRKEWIKRNPETAQISAPSVSVECRWWTNWNDKLCRAVLHPADVCGEVNNLNEYRTCTEQKGRSDSARRQPERG